MTFNTIMEIDQFILTQFKGANKKPVDKQKRYFKKMVENNNKIINEWKGGSNV